MAKSISRITITFDDDLEHEDRRPSNSLSGITDYDRRESDASSITNFTHTVEINEFHKSSPALSHASSSTLPSIVSPAKSSNSKQSTASASTSESKEKHGVRKLIQKIFKSSSSSPSKGQVNRQTLAQKQSHSPVLNIDSKHGTAYPPLSPLPVTQGPIRLLVLRHGERLDRYYSSQWLRQAFDKDANYCRFSPILP